MPGKIIKRMILVLVLFFLLVLGGSVWAAPTSAENARKVVKGLLNLDGEPLGMALGGSVENVDTYTDSAGDPMYYVVYLEPSGFVIVSGDDLVEPIIAFSASSDYEASNRHPLGALVNVDLPGRITWARWVESILVEGQELPAFQKAVRARTKWAVLQDCSEGRKAAEHRETVEITGSPGQGGLGSISDVRVSPLIESKWGQRTVCGLACYNYYTPRVVDSEIIWEEGNAANYQCGCGPTAAAQIMRYHEYPTNGIGTGKHRIEVKVDGEWVDVWRSTRGGDGEGGAYEWDQMVLVPGCSITEAQRQAIGALCYDIGVCTYAKYSSDGTETTPTQFYVTFKSYFGYSSAEHESWWDEWYLDDLNSNLDSSHPVMLSVIWYDPDMGHGVVADGYGYNNESMYHHLNYGWSGGSDAWYNLPDHCDQIMYLCNIYTSGSGDIVSGRVTDDYTGDPISGVTVRALGTSHQAETNTKGIYALAKISPQGTYTIRATKVGYSFEDRQVNTAIPGRPLGNLWAIDFEGNTIDFYVKNSSGGSVAWFDDGGNLALKGSLTEDTTPSATSNDEFRVQDSYGSDVAIIDATDGYMYIKGWLYEEQGTLTPPAGSFIVRSRGNVPVAYIDQSGNVYLTGKLYENSIP